MVTAQPATMAMILAPIMKVPKKELTAEVVASLLLLDKPFILGLEPLQIVALTDLLVDAITHHYLIKLARTLASNQLHQ